MKKYLFILIALFFHLFGFSQLTPTRKAVVFKFHIVDYDNKPRQGEKIIVRGQTTNKVLTGVSNSKGNISLLVPKGDRYGIQYQKLFDSVFYGYVNVPQDTAYRTHDFKVRFEIPPVYTLKDVNFEQGKADISPESYPALDEVAEMMKRKLKTKIEISGHTDSIGNPQYNLQLSEDRAKNVRKYLIKKGVPEIRVFAKGYGDLEPVAENTTEEGRQKNRRTEVRILAE